MDMGIFCCKDQKEEIREENNGVTDGEGAGRDRKDINPLYSRKLPILKL